LSPAAEAQEKPIRVGVAGFGLAGRIFHAAAIDAVPGLELAAIAQPSRTAAAAAYPRLRVVGSVEELLEDPSIRLIAVATPNRSHFSVARSCLLADRDVVVDKPFALNSGEAAELIRLARSRRRLLSVYQNRRWDGDYRTLCRLLHEGVLGRPVFFESRYDRFRPQPNLNRWRENGEPGGGILLDRGPHLLDQALKCFGLPDSLWADVRIEREGGRIDDAFDICLRYSQSGLLAWLRATVVALGPGPRFTIHGTRGSFVKGGMDPQEEFLRAGNLYAASPWGADPEERWGELTLDRDGKPERRRLPTEIGDYRGYYANVRDALLGRAALEVTPLQAWHTMRVLEMAEESSAQRRELPCAWGPTP
jgi:predicted dehydrogenase